MSLFKKWDGSIKIKNILGIAAIIIVAVILISINDSISKGEKFTDIVKNIANKQEIGKFLQSIGGLAKGILVSAIVVLPLFIYGWYKLIKKEDAFLWGAILGILLFFTGVSTIPIKTAIFFAWAVNVIMLFISIRVGVNGKIQIIKPWFVFALVSTIAGPTKSFVMDNATSFWFVASITGMGISYLFRDVQFKKAYAKIKGKFKKMIGKIMEILKKIDKKCTEYIVQTQTAKDGAVKLGTDITELENAIKTGNHEVIKNAIAKLSEHSKTLESMPELDIIDSTGISSLLNENLQEQTEKVKQVKESLTDDNKFKNTELGKIKEYLTDLAKKTFSELKGKGNSWDEFLKMKETGFKEIVDRLRATKIARLEKYAKFLEKNYKKMWIKTFIGLMLRWTKEIELERKTIITNIERAEKDLKKTTSETVLDTGYKIDEKLRQTMEDFELLKKYDLQVKAQYVKITKILKGIDESGTEEATSKINELKEMVGWIGKYLGDREKALKGIKERMIETQRFTDNNFEKIEEGVLPSAEIELNSLELIGGETG